MLNSCGKRYVFYNTEQIPVEVVPQSGTREGTESSTVIKKGREDKECVNGNSIPLIKFTRIELMNNCCLFVLVEHL